MITRTITLTLTAKTPEEILVAQEEALRRLKEGWQHFHDQASDKSSSFRLHVEDMELLSPSS